MFLISLAWRCQYFAIRFCLLFCRCENRRGGWIEKCDWRHAELPYGLSRTTHIRNIDKSILWFFDILELKAKLVEGKNNWKCMAMISWFGDEVNVEGRLVRVRKMIINSRLEYISTECFPKPALFLMRRWEVKLLHQSRTMAATKFYENYQHLTTETTHMWFSFQGISGRRHCPRVLWTSRICTNTALPKVNWFRIFIFGLVLK